MGPTPSPLAARYPGDVGNGRGSRRGLGRGFRRRIGRGRHGRYNGCTAPRGCSSSPITRAAGGALARPPAVRSRRSICTSSSRTTTSCTYAGRPRIPPKVKWHHSGVWIGGYNRPCRMRNRRPGAGRGATTGFPSRSSRSTTSPEPSPVPHLRLLDGHALVDGGAGGQRSAYPERAHPSPRFHGQSGAMDLPRLHARLNPDANSAPGGVEVWKNERPSSGTMTRGRAATGVATSSVRPARTGPSARTTRGRTRPGEPPDAFDARPGVQRLLGLVERHQRCDDRHAAPRNQTVHPHVAAFGSVRESLTKGQALLCSTRGLTLQPASGREPAGGAERATGPPRATPSGGRGAKPPGQPASERPRVSRRSGVGRAGPPRATPSGGPAGRSPGTRASERARVSRERSGACGSPRATRRGGRRGETPRIERASERQRVSRRSGVGRGGVRPATAWGGGARAKPPDPNERASGCERSRRSGVGLEGGSAQVTSSG